jgi:hypothetical protein
MNGKVFRGTMLVYLTVEAELHCDAARKVGALLQEGVLGMSNPNIQGTVRMNSWGVTWSAVAQPLQTYAMPA